MKYLVGLLTTVLVTYGSSSQAAPGDWVAGIHDYESFYSFYSQLRSADAETLESFLIQAELPPYAGQRDLQMTYDDGVSGFDRKVTLSCRRVENLNCTVSGGLPALGEKVDYFTYQFDRDSALRLSDALAKSFGPKQSQRLDLDGGRLALSCEQESEKHFPICKFSLQNRFIRLNDLLPGHSDPIQIRRVPYKDGIFRIALSTFHLGPDKNNFAFELFEALPFKFKLFETPVHGFEADYNSADVRNYPNHISGNLSFDFEEADHDEFSLPLQFERKISGAAARSLKENLGSRRIEGFLGTSSQAETDNYVHKNKRLVIRPRAEIDCRQSESCTLRVSIVDRLITPDYP